VTRRSSGSLIGGLGAGWSLLLADLLALLLTFFILIFSYTSFDQASWSAMTQALSAQLNDKAAPARPDASGTPEERAGGLSLDYVTRLLEERRADNKVLAQATLIRSEDRLTLRLPHNALFTADDAVQPDIHAALGELGVTFAHLGHGLEITTHLPPGMTPAAAWPLGLARAERVAQALRQATVLPDVTLVSAADADFSLFLTNYELAARYALADRVEISILHRGAATEK
jgi:chemotaxis protein MotB